MGSTETVDSVLASLDPARLRALQWARQKFGSSSEPLGEEQVKPSSAYKRQKARVVSAVDEKRPADNYEKCTVAVYYLGQELGVEAVNVDDVFTCCKDAGWCLPAGLQNMLALTSHRKGWLDTSDLRNTKLTTHSENFIEYDLSGQQAKNKWIQFF